MISSLLGFSGGLIAKQTNDICSLHSYGAQRYQISIKRNVSARLLVESATSTKLIYTCKHGLTLD